MRNASHLRAVNAGLAVVFAAFAVGLTLARGLQGGGWISTRPMGASILFVLSMMSYAKLGDRIAALKAMDDPRESAP